MNNTNKEVLTAWFDQVWNRGDETAIERLMAPNARFHGLASDAEPIVGPAAFKPFFQAFRQAFPDISIKVLHTVSEGSLVACHCSVTGTHNGAGLGAPPTGSSMGIQGMTLAVIEGGQIQEGWNCYDFMALYQQVGMLPNLPA